MRAVTIHDLRQPGTYSALAFDLIDLLRLDESGVRTSAWRCRSVDCMSEQDEPAVRLHSASHEDAVVSGVELLRLASGVYQVIDGDFAALRPGAERPWLVIRAVDSSFYVVATEDESFLDRVRERFRDVRDAPEEVEDLALWWSR